MRLRRIWGGSQYGTLVLLGEYPWYELRSYYVVCASVSISVSRSVGLSTLIHKVVDKPLTRYVLPWILVT